MLNDNDFVSGQVLNQLLERTHHVSKEAHADHFDHDYIQVLDDGMTIDIAVANWRKRGDDPIHACDVNTCEFQVLNTALIVHVYPSLIMLEQVIANEAPETRKQVRNHAKLKY